MVFKAWFPYLTKECHPFLPGILVSLRCLSNHRRPLKTVFLPRFLPVDSAPFPANEGPASLLRPPVEESPPVCAHGAQWELPGLGCSLHSHPPLPTPWPKPLVLAFGHSQPAPSLRKLPPSPSPLPLAGPPAHVYLPLSIARAQLCYRLLLL